MTLWDLRYLTGLHELRVTGASADCSSIGTSQTPEKLSFKMKHAGLSKIYQLQVN